MDPQIYVSIEILCSWISENATTNMKATFHTPNHRLARIID